MQMVSVLKNKSMKIVKSMILSLINARNVSQDSSSRTDSVMSTTVIVSFQVDYAKPAKLAINSKMAIATKLFLAAVSTIYRHLCVKLAQEVFLYKMDFASR